MLALTRRFQGIAVAAIFVLLMLGGFVPDPFVTSNRQQTLKASEGGIFHTLARRYKEVHTYFKTNMNYAALAPLLHSSIRYGLYTSSNPNVYIGLRRHLFYTGDHAATQSAGQTYRPIEVDYFVKVAASLHRALERLGANLVVTFPPNAQSIAIDDLPSWSKSHPPFEYDLAVNQLRKHGIIAIDLKTPLLARNDRSTLYRTTDTHWTGRGALAAFNLTVSGAGHPEWTVDPAIALGPPRIGPGGDLARFLGIQRYLTDAQTPLLPAPEGLWEKIDIFRSSPFGGVFKNYVYRRKGAASGENVLVIGDSFTYRFWLPLLKRSNAKRIGWMHHRLCSFDFTDVERFRPTLVILAPTERYIPCSPGAWPAGLPRK
jgi:hypothetical protein